MSHSDGSPAQNEPESRPCDLSHDILYPFTDASCNTRIVHRIKMDPVRITHQLVDDLAQCICHSCVKESLFSLNYLILTVLAISSASSCVNSFAESVST